MKSTKATSASESGHPRVAVGLGANLGDARRTLELAFEALDQLAGAPVRRSSFWRSAPVDAQGPDFHNAVAVFETALSPIALLDALQHIEARFGRERPYRNAPRTLDLDLLLYADERCDTPRLVLPHPRAHQRAFVLAPLAELLPGGEIPGHGPIAALLGGVTAAGGQALSRLRDS